MRIQSIGLFSGHKMTYYEDGAGPAVVLIHGLPGSGASLFRLGRQLALLQRRVVIPDLLGFGASSRASDLQTLWADNQADSLLQVLRVARVNDAVVVGHDFGGAVALILYERAPDIFSRLLLVSSNPLSDAALPMALAPANWPLVGDWYLRYKLSPLGLKSYVQAGMGKPVVNLEWKSYLGGPDQVAAAAILLKKIWRGYGQKAARVEEALQRLRLPTKLVYGSRDPYLSARTAAHICRKIPAGTLTVFERAGHWLPEERPQELARLIVG